MFKDDGNGKTNNIYDSFRKTLDKHGACEGWMNELDELCLDDLNHLKWLIEQQINVLNNKETK